MRQHCQYHFALHWDFQLNVAHSDLLFVLFLFENSPAKLVPTPCRGAKSRPHRSTASMIYSRVVSRLSFDLRSARYRGCLQHMVVAQNLCGTLADDDAGSHGIACGHSWHHGTICDAKVFDSIHLKLGVDNRHRISSHLRGTRLMVVCDGRVADEVFQCSSL